MRIVWRLLSGAALISLASVSQAQETQTYSYDAKGRLIKVERTGGPQDGADNDYAYDAANNRTSVATAGAKPISNAYILPVGGKILVVPEVE
ncbi:RHS repeat domain-containing protein [Parasphingorhabdus sp.]|uniref:RHS repeat domain-containing protein n=1 Tax=Parasphingorhabdus sp. TaxID=2709688 RepID=UPI003266FEB5